MARAEPVRRYNRVMLVDHQGAPISGESLSRGDAFIFQEIIMNFVENAAKYSPEASTITLSAKKAVCDGRGNL